MENIMQLEKSAALKGSQEMPINDIVNKIDMPAKSKVDRTVTIGSKVYTLNDYNNTFYELNKIKKVLSPIEWQRLISELAIRGYGSLKPTLLRPIIIAIRPNGKVVIIDGQHRVALILNTLDPDNIPPLFVQEYVHDKNLSEDECKKIESYLFKNLNVEYKSLNKMTIIRSGVQHDDPDALWVLTVLTELDLHYDNFGSDNDTKKKLTAPSGLYQLIFNTGGRFKYNGSPLTNNKNLNILKQGMKRYKEKWGKGGDKDFENGVVHGALLKASILEHEYSEEVLDNGTKEDFNEFCGGGGFTYDASSGSLKKMLGTSGACDKIYMGWLIDRYRKHGQKSGNRNSIGSKTLAKGEKISKKFDFSNYSIRN